VDDKIVFILNVVPTMYIKEKTSYGQNHKGKIYLEKL